ncbi:unnamed protein product [Arctia plantaginis]|uniref:acylphosphatase n=1 Tax=Arctia plantaginis TaxID=874455 RepID=A0A8S1B6D7_ARCPL|nr:unnamed protein product [Arctia plantaginis]
MKELPERSLPGLHEHRPVLYNLVAVDFEVYGKVHGVHFEEFTKEQADKLGVRGWCMNTAHGTVQGQLQGSEDNIQAMMNWLKSKGSPASEIERAEFRNQQSILELTFNDFTIRRE